MALLDIRDLTLAVEGRSILKGLTFSIKEGEIHALLGTNGTGKSTVANLIMGSGGLRPQAGRIFFKGEDITGLPIHERARRGITMAWQEPVRFEGITVKDYLHLGWARPATTDRAGPTTTDQARPSATGQRPGAAGQRPGGPGPLSTTSGGEAFKREGSVTSRTRPDDIAGFSENHASNDSEKGSVTPVTSRSLQAKPDNTEGSTESRVSDDEEKGSVTPGTPEAPQTRPDNAAGSTENQASNDSEKGSVTPLLEMVGLSPELYLHRMVDRSLSGGQRKRVELASVLGLGPALAILDEPDSGIDMLSTKDVINVIQAFKGRGASVLLITHREEIARGADTASLLCGGRIVCAGDPGRVAEYYRNRKCVICDGRECVYV
ncbi:MAG: ATP-binding cassette domain-containing protein [Nitrospirota bacterium]|jgi:Fe-S cluster assembly ATPase SufC